MQYCPKCGKMLELQEKNFCTGCGVELKAGESVKEITKGPSGPLPFGARYVSSDVEMKAMCKGMVLGGFLGFALFTMIAILTFLRPVAESIGIGVFGLLLFMVPAVFVVSKLSNNAKEKLAESFNFIPTEGVIYHAVDFLIIKFPSLISNPQSQRKNVKSPASERARTKSAAKKSSKQKK